MKRRLVFVLLALAATASIAAAGMAATTGPTGGGRGEGGNAVLHRGAAYFAVACGFSHRNQDDAIVFPNAPNRSHDHTYFGNTATNASSTAASLRAAGRTTCRLRADTAAYWIPTLFVSGRAVNPIGATIFYVRRTVEQVRAFPAAFEMIAGTATARSAQPLRVTSWDCYRQRDEASSEIPTCAGGTRAILRLRVNFPECWDGKRLDSADHKGHLAYATNNACPATHPVEVPAITLVAYYRTAGGAAAELSSGGDFSGHADFVNAWNQDTLQRLVDRYLNRIGRRGGRG